jgi:membrane protein implicated in regulation of membrane protease activity
MPKIVYFWWGLALALMAAETFVPGAFLLWFGFAAAVMGGILYLLPSMPPLAQAVTFALLSFFSVWIYRRWFRKLEPMSDQPLLNRRIEQMVGRTFELVEPIHNGYGKIRVNDALWTVQGPDLPDGVRVVVTGASGMTLAVRAAE